MSITERLARIGLVGLGALFGCGDAGTVPGPPARLDHGTPRLHFQESLFPDADGWARATAEDAGWDAALLAEAVEVARQSNTTSFVVVYQGRVLADECWEVDPGALPELDRLDLELRSIGRSPDGHLLEDVTSIEKGVLAVLAAIAADRGILALDRPVSELLGRGWSEAPPADEQRITVRHVMSMTAGLDDRRRLIAPAGETWRYQPFVPYLLFDVLIAATDDEPRTWLAEWLGDPIGLEATRWGPIPGYPRLRTLWTTGPDLARIGWLLACGGEWSGRVLLSRAGVAALFEPSQELNPAFGLLWYLNRPGALSHAGGALEGAPFPSAPPDLAIAIGKSDSFLGVSPSEQLVVVRLGAKIEGPERMAGIAAYDRIWRLLMQARPGS